MEIIEQGNPKIDTRIYQFKCKCGCRFNAIYPNDFKHFGYDPLSITEMVACPVCGRLHGRGLVSKLRYLFNSESKGEAREQFLKKPIGHGKSGWPWPGHRRESAEGQGDFRDNCDDEYRNAI